MKSPINKFIPSDHNQKLSSIDFQRAYHRAFEESVRQWEKLEVPQMNKTPLRK